MDTFALDARIAAIKASPEKAVRKQFVISRERAVDEEARTVRFTITNGDVDRDEDTIDPKGWDVAAFLRSPTVCWAHDYAALPIARALDVTVVGGELQSTAQFPPKGVHPFADTVFELVKGGFLNACSVGFKPIEYVRDEKRGGLNFIRQSLLEWSICGIPSNPGALVVARAQGIDLEPLKAWAEGILKGIAMPVQTKAVKGDDVLTLDDEVKAGAAADCPTCDGTGKIRGGKVDCPDCDGTGKMKSVKADMSTCTACGGPMENGKCAACGQRAPDSPELVAGMEVHASLDAPADDPIRWNRRLSKAFDVDGEPLDASKLEYTWVSRFLNTPVKDLYETTLNIPSPRMGSYLSALDEKLAPFKTETVRRLTYGGAEEPPVYETIQLNSKLSKTFLVDGIRFLTGPQKMVAKIAPSWCGVSLTAYGPATSSEKILDFLNSIGTRAAQYKFMKGEAFALSGEFLDRGAETWSDLFLAPVDLEPIKRTVALVNETGAEMESRGLIFAGRPGTGKTLGGRVMMNEAKDATFIWVSTRDFYRSGAIGGLSLAYDLAAENAPSIVFVEDIDSWLDNSAIDMLKTELDGIKQRKGIVTVLTTNFPESLPEALIDRPGRFHDVLIMSLPTETIRRAMLAKWAPDAKPATLDKLAADTRAYSGAHLRELVRFADTIRAQDGTVIDAALTQAMEKVTAQRTLIDETRRGPKLRSLKTMTFKSTLLTLQKKDAGEEAAELVSYQTLGTMLDQVGSLLTAARGLVSGLVSDETDTPTQSMSGEAAEEALETARLDSLVALCQQMIGGLEGVWRLALDTNADGAAVGILPYTMGGGADGIGGGGLGGGVMAAVLAKRVNGHGTCAHCGTDGDIAVQVCAECVNKLHPWDGEALAARVVALAKAVTKRGRVISAKNEAKIKTAHEHIGSAAGHLDDVLKSIGDAPMMEEAAVSDAHVLTLTMDDDDIEVVQIDMDDADESFDVTKQELREVLQGALKTAVSGIVQAETQATLNRLRGRVD